MEQVKLKFKYECCDNFSSFPVVIVAAGSSTRMNGVNKQLLSICGVPVVIRTMQQFDNSPYVSRIILVARKDDIISMQRLADEYGIKKLSDIIEGGSDRHTSVLNGLSRLRKDEPKVLIHDGARPLVSDFIIGNVSSALETCDAVICGNIINDTVKRADAEGNVSETVDRNGLYAIQTPQGINVGVYLSACEKLTDASVFTDDAGIFEAAGLPVKIVQGSPCNIKITTPKDVALAELYLREEML